MMIKLCPSGMGNFCQIQNFQQCRACWTCLPRKGWSGCKCVAKSVTNPLFWVPKKIGKIQPPDFQSPHVLHPLRIIQHPWELIPLNWWGTHINLRWYDMSNSLRMYIGLNSVINWGHVLNWGQKTFRHYYIQHQTFSKPTLKGFSRKISAQIRQ